MSRRRNKTNRAGSRIGLTYGYPTPKKKKSLPAATGQAQEHKKYNIFSIKDLKEDCKNEIVRTDR